MSERDLLLADVFHCMHCKEFKVEFEKCPNNNRFYRFPPVIGALGDVAVLFIGINPRIAASNQSLHDSVSVHMSKFKDLSNNIYNNISYLESEKHYKFHTLMMDELFPGKPFENVAAVTELYYCASKDSSNLNLKRCFCAERYMGRVFELTRPKIVIAVGRMVEKYLRNHSLTASDIFKINMGGHAVSVISVPHPNAFSERKKKWEKATAAVKSILGNGNLLPINNHPKAVNTIINDKVIIIKNCNWSNIYGWKPAQRPDDLDKISKNPDSRIEFHLKQPGGKTAFVLLMSAAEWKKALGKYYSRPGSLWRQNGYVVSINKTKGGKKEPTQFVARWRPYISRPD